MRYTTIATLAAVALGVASAIAPADAGHVKRGWKVGVLPTNSGYAYGPHYGYPTYPSYWNSATSGVYAVPPHLCYVPRGYPTLDNWYTGNLYYGTWHYRQWQWALENVC